LLRQAQDAHVSVQAGDVQIGTRSNSTPPNFNFQLLQKAVPGWTEHPSGVVTGRFDDGVGYILFNECSSDQANGVDTALDDLKDTSGLILDVRPNGGGDEGAAQRVAGRFVEKSTVYAKDRIREQGKWKGPLDRVVDPRHDANRYGKPVALLIGPKVVSSAESFVLMMKYGTRAKLIGDTTGGSSGRPVPHQLGNGVTVYLSSWEDQLPDGRLVENLGVEPDLPVRTTLRSLARSDDVLDAALKYLRSASDQNPPAQK
jgi:C-terminal processing protease CtpA/Prc